MKKIYKRVLISCLSVSLIAGTLVTPIFTGAATLEEDTAVAGMAVSLSNYYAKSDTPEADIIDFLKLLAASSWDKASAEPTSVSVVVRDESTSVFAKNMIAEGEIAESTGLVSTIASLNVRNQPSASSSVIGYLYSNCVVSIYNSVSNSEGTWYLIRSGEVEGYVSADYVLTGDAARSSDEDLSNRYAVVTADAAAVYSSASSNADIVGEVYKEGNYKVLEIQNGYVKLQISDNFAGYVRMENVSMYTRYPSAVAITDDMVRNQLEAYLVDINDSQRIYTERMGNGDYQAAYNAITYAYELWGYYIADSSNAGYDDLAAAARAEQAKVAVKVEQARAALNGQEITTAAQQQSSIQEESSTVPQTSAQEESSTVPQTSAQEESSTVPQTSTQEESSTVPQTSTQEESSTVPQTSTQEENTTAAPASSGEESSIDSIVAYYTGSTKTAGQVISASEIYIEVYYTDGSREIVTEGWSCDMVGMALSAGWNTITVSYQGYSSVFELNAASVEPETTVPEPTTAIPETTAAAPETTTAIPETTAAVPETTTALPETTTAVPETTAAVPETTTAVPETTTAVPETTTAAEAITTPAESSTPLRDALVNYALSFVGRCSYVWGGATLAVGGQVDCSGFTMCVYRDVAGVSLPHHSISQMSYGSAISFNDLRPGDLVFYSNPNHVAIYIGGGAIVHAKNESEGIAVDSVFFKAPIGYRTYLP